MLLYHKLNNVNFTHVDGIVVPLTIKSEFKKMMLNRIKAFSTSNEEQPFDTSVVATISKTDNNPIYWKQYPHPMGEAELIIRKVKTCQMIGSSAPPYKNPTCVVDRKDCNEHGNT